MEREILFRGKRIDNGEWVYGCYVKAEKNLHGGDEHFIIEYSCDGSQYLVYPATVGQYTDLKDKNGQKIFEGDIVSIPGTKKQGLPAEIYYMPDASFMVRRLGYMPISLEDSKEWCLIIGNIHDTQELLEVRNEAD